MNPKLLLLTLLLALTLAACTLSLIHISGQENKPVHLKE